jgi:hypothetical protein
LTVVELVIRVCDPVAAHQPDSSGDMPRFPRIPPIFKTTYKSGQITRKILL